MPALWKCCTTVAGSGLIEKGSRICRVGLLEDVSHPKQGLTACRVGLPQTRGWP